MPPPLIEPIGACLRCRGELETDRMYVCVACEEAVTREQARRADLLEAAAAAAAMRRSNLPRAYASGVRTRAHVTIEAPPGSLYIHGSAASGKTTLACVLLAEWIRAGGSGVYAVAPDLMSDLRKIYSAKDGRSSSDLVDPLIEAPVLVLDDVGKEKPSEHAATILFEVLDGRYRRRRPARRTIIASNYSPDALAARFADAETAGPLIRRMVEDATVLLVRAK